MANNLEDRIADLKEMFVGLNIASNIMYLEVKFPENWGISNLVTSRYKVKVTKSDTPGNYYFYGPLGEVSFDTLFDAVEFNIKANQEAEEKKEFLVAKIAELKKIVAEEDMSVLKTLEFKIKKNKKTLPKIEGVEDVASEEKIKK